MAWRCTGKTNAQLVSNMTASRLLHSERVVAAFLKVDRANYVLEKSEAYMDSPQPIKYGATISAPHMHAHAAENLLPYLKPGGKVLDVGSGSGYTCAIFHHLVTTPGGPGNDDGVVVGIDHIPELVQWSIGNLCRDGLGTALDAGSVRMVAGDGRQGWSSAGPYDAIHVGAAAPSIPPALVEQLAAPGRMFIPVGGHSQDVIQVDKDASGNVTQKTLFGVMYVPLTDPKTQLDGY